jgi:hypothetical protein
LLWPSHISYSFASDYKMPNIQPLLNNLHLHSSKKNLQTCTSPSSIVFDKSVMDMDMMTCCKWTNELIIGLLWLTFWGSQQKQYLMCKIFHSCIHLQWSHFYKCLFNLCIYCYHESVMDHLHGTANFKTFTNGRTIKKYACKCCFKCYE